MQRKGKLTISWLALLLACAALAIGGCNGENETPQCIDNDGDTYGANCNPGPDCNDENASIHPGADEVCGDNVDNDCDDLTDEDCDQCSDGDGDGYGDPASAQCAHPELDCDDSDAAIHPGATITCGTGVCEVTVPACDGANVATCTPGTPDEVTETSCDDGLDNDCDGQADDQDLDCNECIDGDGDTYGQYCAAGPDCDDTDGDIHPGAEEVCDNVDNDCDDQTDEGDVCTECVDSDGDGHYAEGANCPTGDDCDDTNPDIHPDAVENPFNHVDDDCDDITDETVDSPLQGQVIFNEVLIDGNCGQDANGDGDVDATADEFVEIVNNSGSAVSMSGWTLYDAHIARPRHTFMEGTSVPAGHAVVVFGGEPGLENHAGVQYFGADNDDGSLQYGLSLNNDPGDAITLYDDQLRLVAQFAYGDHGSNEIVLDESSTRSPDVSGSFQPHSQASGNPDNIFSPGNKIDGSNFP